MNHICHSSIYVYGISQREYKHCYRCLQNKHPLRNHALRLLSPLAQNINVEGDEIGSGSACKINTISARAYYSALTFGDAGGQDDAIHDILRTGVYFANKYMNTRSNGGRSYGNKYVCKEVLFSARMNTNARMSLPMTLTTTRIFMKPKSTTCKETFHAASNR